jgi:hypothetical protein
MVNTDSPQEADKKSVEERNYTAIGLSLGISFGVAFCAALDQQKRRRSRDTS